MSSAPPERQWLLHTVFVTLNRNHYVRCHEAHITGTIRVLCRNVDIPRIMLQYPHIASYYVMKAEDTTSGKEYPELKTGIVYNTKEE